jgi:DDE family transposase
MEGDLRDDQWEVIAPLLPLPKKRGRPRANDRGHAQWHSLGAALRCQMVRPPQEVWSPFHLPSSPPGMATPGSMERDLAHLPERPEPTGPTGLEPGFPGWQFCPGQKRGEDIAYGWKGKGSTVHLLTEGKGLPLAFLATAANVSEVTVGLKVVDQVRVPRPQGRPKKRPASLGADKSYDSAEFRYQLRRRHIQPAIPRREWPKRRRRPGLLLKYIGPASIAGRWSGVMAG